MGTMFEITDGPNKGKRFWLPHQEEADDSVRGWIPTDQSVMEPMSNSGTHCSVPLKMLKRLTPIEEHGNDYLTANKLAAISVACMSDTPVTMAANLLPEGHVLDTAAYRDAVRTVRKVIDLREENKELVVALYSILRSSQNAKFADDISEADYGVSALAARKLIEASTYAKSIE